MMETLIDTGIHMGLSREASAEMVMQMMKGSIALAEDRKEKHIVSLRNDITSSGGTTANAIYMMEKGNLRTVVSDGVWSAFKRSLQLGGKDVTKTGPV